MYLEAYNLKWTTQSKNSGESMPLGGHDIGCNVWVEKGDLLFYMAQSGAFDETCEMLKAGRIRLRFDRDLFADGFSQELRLRQGDIQITGRAGDCRSVIRLWVEVRRPVIHVEVSSDRPVGLQIRYELWREDTVAPRDGEILFYHRNTSSPVLEERLAQQGIEHLRYLFPDVERDRTSGGILRAEGTRYKGTEQGRYIDNDYTAYILETPGPVREQRVEIGLTVAQEETAALWERRVRALMEEALADPAARETALRWWGQYWERSYVAVAPGAGEDQVDWQVGRNYQLFRYMLAANAYGEFPTKFNGGLFTIDQNVFARTGAANPDYRAWFGMMFTAQNQRLVYWPMVKGGDFEMMKPQFEFYKRLVAPMKARTAHFFGLEDCACYCEQIDANGLSGYYGDHGLDYPLQVRHHHVEAVEFSYMMLRYHLVSGEDIGEYIPFILSVLNYYDRRYARRDREGKRVLFPSTAMETYHAAPCIDAWGEEGRRLANYNEEETAVGNPADLIAALDSTIELLCATRYLTPEDRQRLLRLKEELPPIPTEVKRGKTVVAPCAYPKNYVKGNSEIPQLNTCHPYHYFGLNKPDLQLAVDTYFCAWDDEDQLWHASWHPNGAYAARLGLADEAMKYARLKLGDSGRRFPAFWGPGHDYTPDHNWGGCGMMGLQEMLLQELDSKLYLLPAWPREIDVEFKLWASHRTQVEARYVDGTLSYTVTPKEREADVVVRL